MKNGKVYRPLVEKDLGNLKAGDIVYHCDTHEPFVIEKVDKMFLFDKKNNSWTYTSFDVQVQLIGAQ